MSEALEYIGDAGCKLTPPQEGAAIELADILFKAGLCHPYPKALVDAEEIIRHMSRRGCHVWREYK